MAKNSMIGLLQKSTEQRTRSLGVEFYRYGLNRVPVNERLCETCNLVEDEIHVLLQCSMFDDIRARFKNINGRTFTNKQG